MDLSTIEPLIIEAAINEQAPKTLNPHVPYTANDCAAVGIDAIDAGASIIHLHARDASTGALLSPGTEVYAEAMRRIRRARPDALFYPTYATGPDRFAHVAALADDPEVRCDLATVDPGVVNFAPVDETAGAAGLPSDFFFSVGHADARTFLSMCRERNVLTSFVIREPGHLRTLLAYERMGMVNAPLLLRICLSDLSPWGLPPTMAAVEAYLAQIPSHVAYRWMAYTYGPSHWSMNLHAIASGGHVRTGLGDNPVEPDGACVTNAEKVARVVEIARLAGRRVASCAETRAMLSGDRRD